MTLLVAILIFVGLTRVVVEGGVITNWQLDEKGITNTAVDNVILKTILSCKVNKTSYP